MRTAVALVGLLAVLALASGCDENVLPENVKMFLTAKGPGDGGVGDMLQLQTRLQDRLQDGTCAPVGDQHQYGGANGNGGAGGSGGNGGGAGGGSGDLQRNRDGSCGD